MTYLQITDEKTAFRYIDFPRNNQGDTTLLGHTLKRINL